MLFVITKCAYWVAHYLHICSDWLKTNKANSCISIYKRRNFYDFVNQYTIVELEEWSIASIIRVGTSQNGVKTLLWIKEHITKSIVIHYEGFELSQCLCNWDTSRLLGTLINIRLQNVKAIFTFMCPLYLTDSRTGLIDLYLTLKTCIVSEENKQNKKPHTKKEQKKGGLERRVGLIDLHCYWYFHPKLWKQTNETPWS